MTNHQSPNPQTPNLESSNHQTSNPLLSLIAKIIAPHLKTKHKDTVSIQLAQEILDTYRDYDPS